MNVMKCSQIYLYLDNFLLHNSQKIWFTIYEYDRNILKRPYKSLGKLNCYKLEIIK